MTHLEENESLPPLFVMASENEAGLRADVFLSKALCQLSRSRIIQEIKEGHILRDEKPFRPKDKVQNGDTFSIRLPAPKETSLKPWDLPLDIIYEDEDLLVLNKACGLTVHPGAGNQSQTLCHALVHHYPTIHIGDSLRPGIVHRLDKDTSGVMVVAKTDQAHRALTKAFQNREVEKVYRAFCFGHFSKKTFELKTGHMRHPKNPLKFFTGFKASPNASSSVRFAHSSFRVIKEYPQMSELLVSIHTGRTHQIRAQLSDIGHPVVGDKLYGGQRKVCADQDPFVRTILQKIKRQALHAEKICFVHPVKRTAMEFVAPLPEDLKLFVHESDKDNLFQRVL